MERHWDKLNTVLRKFKEHLRHSEVLPLDYLPYEGHRSIEAHARYFTDRQLVPYDKNQPFFYGVDPNGALKQLQPEQFIHAPDNYVEYLMMSVDDHGNER